MAERTVSVFDLDHTLIRVNSSFHFGSFLYQKGVISWYQALSLVFLYARHKFLGMSLQKLHESIFQRLFYGKKSSFFEKLVNEYLDTRLDGIVYTPGYQCLIEAQREQHTTLILSASPSFIVEGIADRFAVDGFFATHYRRDQHGCFSQVGSVVNGQEKARFVREDLRGKYDRIDGYSDSWLDLPFLEAVDHPVAVNPRGKLRPKSQKRHWKVIK